MAATVIAHPGVTFLSVDVTPGTDSGSSWLVHFAIPGAPDATAQPAATLDQRMAAVVASHTGIVQPAELGRQIQTILSDLVRDGPIPSGCRASIHPGRAVQQAAPPPRASAPAAPTPAASSPPRPPPPVFGTKRRR